MTLEARRGTDRAARARWSAPLDHGSVAIEIGTTAEGNVKETPSATSAAGWSRRRRHQVKTRVRATPAVVTRRWRVQDVHEARNHPCLVRRPPNHVPRRGDLAPRPNQRQTRPPLPAKASSHGAASRCPPAVDATAVSKGPEMSARCSRCVDGKRGHRERTVAVAQETKVGTPARSPHRRNSPHAKRCPFRCAQQTSTTRAARRVVAAAPRCFQRWRSRAAPPASSSRPPPRSPSSSPRAAASSSARASNSSQQRSRNWTRACAAW